MLQQLHQQQQQQQLSFDQYVHQQQHMQQELHNENDMDIGMELDFDLDCDMHDSPPSGSGSSNGSSPEEQALHSFTGQSTMMEGSSATPMSSVQQQQHALMHHYGSNGMVAATTASALSSPPDTPLLSTPVSPAGAFGVNNGSVFNTGVWGLDGSMNPAAVQMQQQTYGLNAAMNHQQQQAKGPSAFDSIHLHLPPKNGMQLGRMTFPFAAQQQQHQQQQMFQHHHQQQQRSHGLYLASLNARNAAAGLNGNANAPTLGALNSHGAYSTAEYTRALGLSGLNGGLVGGGGYGGGGSMNGNGAIKQEKLAMAIPPSLLLGNGNGGSMTSAWNTPMTTPAQSRSGSPTSGSGVKKEVKPSAGLSNGNANASSSSSTAGPSTNGSSSTAAGASASAPTTPIMSTPLLMQKPFKCPKPGCMKSYKQANGLKYHLTHGQCLYTPSAELLALSEEGLSEREAERKLRPFCCQVPPCQRRYKNMNGLRYHYQHSGEHGGVGLALLASGNHDATKSHPSPPQVSLGLEDALPLSPTSPQQAHPPAATMTKQQHHRTSPPASAPPTPTTAVHRMQQQQRKFIFSNGNGNGAGVGMSQPPSAYASPYASPAPTRSGSPQNQSQQQGQVYGGLTQQNMLYQQQQHQGQAWM